MLSRREILDELRRLGFSEFAFLKKSVREFERYMFENYGFGSKEVAGASSLTLGKDARPGSSKVPKTHGK